MFRLTIRCCGYTRNLVLPPPLVRSLSSLPAVVRPNNEEIANSKLSEQNLEIAVRALHQDGLVVIEDVVPQSDLDALNVKMVEDARVLQARGDKSPFNYNQGNLQQDAPPVAEFFRTSIFANPIGTQVMSVVLGPRPKWTFCSGNTAMPNSPPSQRQPVHSDADFEHPAHAFALVVNVPLVDMAARNGSTELWLGTHTATAGGFDAQEGAHGDRASGRIRPALVEERRARRPPCQPEVRKGSIVVRDLRLWHAGMPNRSDEIRVMLAMIHFAPWYRNGMRMRFGSDVRPLVDGMRDLDVRVDWVEPELARKNYLNGGFGNSYDFNQAP